MSVRKCLWWLESAWKGLIVFANFAGRVNSTTVSAIWADLEGFGEGLVDEDDWYENGEALLGEASDVANEETQVESHDQQ